MRVKEFNFSLDKFQSSIWASSTKLTPSLSLREQAREIGITFNKLEELRSGVRKDHKGPAPKPLVQTFLVCCLYYKLEPMEFMLGTGGLPVNRINWQR